RPAVILIARDFVVFRAPASKDNRTLHSAPLSAETICVPRPKRPDRVHREVIDPDDFMADCANLDVPDYRRRIKRRAARLIDDFVATWERRARRGRKPEAKRDALINALARLFREHSGWESRYGEKEYRVGL